MTEVVHCEKPSEPVCARREDGGDELAGFITARLCLLAECDPLDRQLLDLSSRLLNSETVRAHRGCMCILLGLGNQTTCKPIFWGMRSLLMHRELAPLPNCAMTEYWGRLS